MSEWLPGGMVVPDHVLACPFCGGHDLSYVAFQTVDRRGREDGAKKYHVLCKTCEALGPAAALGVDAFGRWDVRREADNTRLCARLAVLAAALKAIDAETHAPTPDLHRICCLVVDAVSVRPDTPATPTE